MINEKILVPNSDLFNQDYKLSYFCESLSKYEENQVKTKNNIIIRSKKLKKWYKKDKIRKEKLELFSLFDSKSFKSVRNKFNKLLSKIKEFSEVIQAIILNSLMPYFKTFFNFLDDKNIEPTSNKIKNFFKKTLPKSVKKIMKTKNRAMSRITLKTEIWDRENFIKI